MNFPSKLIEDAVNSFASLPGIGKKTATRLVMHLLNKDIQSVESFGEAIVRMRREIKFCSKCHNVSDAELCSICLDPARDDTEICVVQNFRDVLAIEATNHFKGRYHILGGLISPIEGIGPEKLNIDSLTDRVRTDGVKELIMALNTTMDGDTTIYYISRKLQDLDVKITAISRGIAFGGELEYVDDVTLARSLSSRLPFEQYFKQ